jgi:hypothetical protein
VARGGRGISLEKTAPLRWNRILRPALRRWRRRARSKQAEITLHSRLEIAMRYRQRAAELMATAERLKDDQRHMLLDIAIRYHRLASELEHENDELAPGEIKR